jgi:hypothetical protein
MCGLPSFQHVRRASSVLVVEPLAPLFRDFPEFLSGTGGTRHAVAWEAISTASEFRTW